MKFILVLLLIASTSCHSMKTTNQITNSSIHDIYVLTALNGESTKGKLKKQSTLEINLTTNKIMGNDGCNDFGGSIKNHNAGKQTLTFSEIIATEMYCDETSNAVGNSLRKIKSYQQEKLELIFFDVAGKEILRYKKVD